MGTTTPNIGIYIPSAGETNYSDAFASGMINLDQHDHTGGPNKGLPITSTGLADFSVTFNKLNSNVADTLTGIGTDSSPGNMNRLQILGILRNLFQLATANGFLGKNGANVVARTFQDTATATWTNADSTTGNPSVNFNIGGISPVTVPNGGTGDTSLNPYALLTANTTSIGNVVQPGLGTTGQVFTSNGPGSFGSFQNLPTIPPQTVFQATVVMTASQFRNLKTVPIQIVAPPGSGKVILPITAYGKVQISSTAFSSGSAVYLYWGSAGTVQSNIRFDSGTFDSSTSGYYLPTFPAPSSTVIDSADMENQGLYVSVNSSDFSGGGTSTTATITVFYSVIQI